MNPMNPLNPPIAAAIAVSENIRYASAAANALGIATRDTLALEDGEYILEAYTKDIVPILAGMYEVVASVDHVNDLSKRAAATGWINQLRTLSNKYARAFKPERLPEASIRLLLPKALCDMVAESDGKWRLVLQIVETSAPDHLQAEIISGISAEFLKIAEVVPDALEEALLAPSNPARKDGAKLVEAEWLRRIAAGEDELTAYEALAKAAAENRKEGLGKQLLDLKTKIETEAKRRGTE